MTIDMSDPMAIILGIIVYALVIAAVEHAQKLVARKAKRERDEHEDGLTL